jgi:hypothetical protein
VCGSAVLSGMRCELVSGYASSGPHQEGKSPDYRLTECAPFENRERCGSLKCGPASL